LPLAIVAVSWGVYVASGLPVEASKAEFFPGDVLYVAAVPVVAMPRTTPSAVAATRLRRAVFLMDMESVRIPLVFMTFLLGSRGDERLFSPNGGMNGSLSARGWSSRRDSDPESFAGTRLSGFPSAGLFAGARDLVDASRPTR
jgi:hypothetical protein